MTQDPSLKTEISALAGDLIALAATRGVRIATAESCTGGLVAAALTAIPGSSAVVEAGLVTYSNAAKTLILGVPSRIIERHGAVSADTALAMAEGVLQATDADLVVAVTGIAGPGGGSADKPVGTVWFAVAGGGGPATAVLEHFGDPGRDEVRQLSVRAALRLLTGRLIG